jgi:hypothetical protein
MTDMKMVFDESYGELSFAQRQAYRKFNVSPSDHDDLVEKFGKDDHEGITWYVKNNGNRHQGQFSAFSMHLGR